jgi:hypothetical protein
LASSSELEAAYQHKKATIIPKQGYFASIPDRYEVRFNYTTGRFQQYNLSSGGTRRVRRIGNGEKIYKFEHFIYEETNNYFIIFVIKR